MDLWSTNLSQGGKNIQWRKDILFNKWWCENWTATHKRMKLELSLKPYTKINSKWIKDWNIKLYTIKLLEEYIGRTHFDINFSNIILDPSPRVMKKQKTKINRWDLIKLKRFWITKETINKRQSTEWEKIFAKQASDEGLINLQNRQTSHTTLYKKSPKQSN